MKVLFVVVLCLAETFASAKTLDERVARMLMEDEEFKRGLFTPVCNGIESVINNYAGDIIKFGCDFLNEDFICNQVVNIVGSYFGATKATCKGIIPNSLIEKLKEECEKQGDINNVNIC